VKGNIEKTDNNTITYRMKADKQRHWHKSAQSNMQTEVKIPNIH